MYTYDRKRHLKQQIKNHIRVSRNDFNTGPSSLI